jgi:hypothetical protein
LMEFGDFSLFKLVLGLNSRLIGKTAMPAVRIV